ncbi:MAG: hypothetical protein K0R54_1679 [Clostridiaceae bacterium]|jgi:glycosyltransferase involved in cell wall biosynthesis|nr:hypothetical protein [Clostridiaceae bacterium]
MRISVAIAAYNGEKYIVEQLNSILPQLEPEDEIIISDDGSSDSTLEIIADFSCAQIRVFKNPKKGVISNIENAISHTLGDIIFLCDQDDVWLPDKVSIIKKRFSESRANLVVSDAYIVNDSLEVLQDSFFKLMNSGSGFIKNFIKNTFPGCCMAFKKELKDIILPFPENIPMHDSWIGLLAELKGEVLFIPEKLVYYRRHGDNVTVLKRDSLKQSLIWRKNLAKEILKRKIR